MDQKTVSNLLSKISSEYSFRGAMSITDAFWGDGGKGAEGSLIGMIFNAIMAVRGCGGPGAEHGAFINGKYIKTNQFPLSFLLQKCIVALGPGTALDPIKLFEEIKRFNLDPIKVKIDPRCPIVTQEHIQQEKESANMKRIGSTFSGTGRCMSDAVLRKAKLAKDIKELSGYIDDIPLLVNLFASESCVILESSQGFGLSRYFGTDNYVTSVDVTTGSLIAGVGLDWKLLKKSFLVVKALPTREGTGPMGNVDEFTVQEMEELGIIEYSSIINPETGKAQIRRKAKSIDWDILKKAAMVNGATDIALTFAEHYDPKVRDVKNWDELTPKVKDLIRKIEDVTNAPVTMVNTGKPINSVMSVYENTDSLQKKISEKINQLNM